MASDVKKCAQELCSCTVGDDSKYCSQMCEDNVGVTTLACDCPHTGCTGHAV